MLKGQKKGEKSGKFQGCLTCNKEIYIKPHLLSVKKYCSVKCRGLNQQGKTGSRAGAIITEETRLKLSISHIGQRAWNKGLKGFLAGDKHWKWQGDKPSYRAVHGWITKELGKASRCTFNVAHKSTKFEWANISGSYWRDVEDFVSLCKKCHNDYDRIRRGEVQF